MNSKLVNFLILICVFIQLSLSVSAQQLCQPNNKDCTFVLYTEHDQSSHVVNPNRALKPLSPYSTFKVANSLIALEQGVIKDTKQTLSYDKTKYIPRAWWPPVWKLPSYNLASAFKYSMVSIYQQLAMDIGAKTMQKQLARFEYGNQDISAGLDTFWLGTSLKISALDQVEFLRKIYLNKLKLKQHSVDVLKEIMLVESTPAYKLYAKTGAGKLADNTMLGWYIGFVENKQGVHFFALNLNTKTYAQVKNQRIDMAMAHLKQQKIL